MSWELLPLESVAKVVMGQSPPGSAYNVEGVGLPFFQGKAEFTDLHPEVRKWTTEGSRTAESGDILLSVRAPVGATNLADQTCVIGRGLAAIRAKERLDQQYLHLYLKSREADLKSQGVGTTFDAITGKILKQFQVPVPPLDEQRRIVAELEEQLGHLEATRTRLTETKSQLEKLRPSITDFFLSGKYASKGFEEIEIGSLLQFSGGYMFRSTDWQTAGVPVIKIANVRNGKVDLTGCSFVSESIAADSVEFAVKEGDILITLTGEIGAVGIYRHDFEARLNQRLARVSVRDESKLSPEFVSILLSAPRVRAEMWSRAKGASQPNISVKDISRIRFPLPSRSKQDELVECLSLIQSRIDSVEAEVSTSENLIDSARTSVLHRAFSPPREDS